MRRFLHAKIRCTFFVALAVFIVAGPMRAQSSASAGERTYRRANLQRTEFERTPYGWNRMDA